jgi:hypothetical protein
MGFFPIKTPPHTSLGIPSNRDDALGIVGSVAVRAVAAAGVTAVATLQVIGGGEDDVRAVEVKVLGREF